MILKYNNSAEITDFSSTQLKWNVPKTFELTTNHLYQFNSSAVTKGTPFILNVNMDPAYTLRYLSISSNNSFTMSINNSFELLTNLFVLDVGPNRIGYTNLTEVQTVVIKNPTGTSGPAGNQFTNPNIIDVKYLLIIESI